MAFFDFLFGKKIIIDDDFFGRMLFIQFKKKPQKNYFECKRDFKPSGRPIEVLINADVSGPTSTQKDFFRQIENEYDNLTAKIVPMIENVFRNWKGGFYNYGLPERVPTHKSGAAKVCRKTRYLGNWI
jgi:hypothetical protein